MTKKTALILTTILFLPFLCAYLWFYGGFGRYLLRLMFGMAAFDSIWPATALYLLTSLFLWLIFISFAVGAFTNGLFGWKASCIF
ncbi:hypothetical protein ACQCWA_17755 [Rossellomorea aquimaris]